MNALIKYTLSLLLLGFLTNKLYAQFLNRGDKAIFSKQSQHTLYISRILFINNSTFGFMEHTTLHENPVD